VSDPEQVVCAADVPAEEWERYEQLAEAEGEPPDTPIEDKELV
jgi:hypothetical protein